MTELDSRLAAAFAAWVDVNRDALRARNVAVHLDGPHAPVGMDFVYLLRLDSPRAECEAVLFLGGVVLLATLVKANQSVEQSHVDAETEAEVTAALSTLADGV